MKNILTIDVEEFYQGTEFDNRSNWSELEKQSRVKANTKKLLYILDKYGQSATFFILDDVSARFPELVKEIAKRGQEVASHGASHIPLERMSPDEFEKEIARSKDRLSRSTTYPIYGYRAPFFTMRTSMTWARDILLDHGFRYDSSIFPIYNYLGGDPGAPRFPFNWGGLWEVPISTYSLLGFKVPFSGGFYMRCLPYRWIRRRISRLNRAGQPAVVYLHPREIDPGQPRMKMTPKQELFFYINLKGMEQKLHRLLQDFSFQSIQEMYNFGFRS